MYCNCSFLASEVGTHTLAEIGIMMDVSRERVRQIETIAIQKLRTRLDLRDIKDEFIHQQSLAKWNCKNPASNTKHLREDEGNIICYLDD
jgi:hypothetical protein